VITVGAVAFARKNSTAPAPARTAAPSVVQSGLRIGEPDDSYEVEADRVADEVMAGGPIQSHWSLASLGSGTSVQRKCSCGGSSDSGGECETCKQEHEGKMVQRKAAGPAESSVAPLIVDEVLRSAGQPLDMQTRAFFESRFGWNFSHVRVHADEKSAASAQAVGADAYTVGNHIAFGPGRFTPHLGAGRRLLAHELTHVIQQSHPWHSGIQAKAGTGSGEGRTIQRAAGLITPEKVQEVYGLWVQEFFRARKTTVMTESLDKAVREKVKKQVGLRNFANWERWESAQRAKEEVETEKPASRASDPQATLPERRDRMWEATNQLRAEIVRVEHLAQKLNFGGGVKGAVARGTAGAYTAAYGVGARSVSGVSEHLPMMALGAGGLLLGSELGERTLVKHGRAIKEEGEEMGEDVRTAVRLVGGDLQAAYEATRAPYNKYQKAYTDFTDAGVRFNKDLELEGVSGYVAQAKDFGDMEAAIRAMREAGNEYLMATAKMGIETDAKALDKMASNIIKGSEEAVGTAVMMGLPEVAPGLREIKTAIKGGEGLTAKQLEKAAAEEVSAIAKSGEKAAAKDARRSALKATEEGAMKSGVPREAGPPSAGRAEAPGAGSAPRAGEAGAGDVAAAEAKNLKRPPQEEARQIKQLAKDKDAVKHVSDPAFNKDYDLEIEVGAGGERHTYRRRQSDGSWCRFSTRDCGYKFDPEDQEAINRLAKGEFSQSAGWAIEDYATSLGFSKPREGNFPGIDGWKGGKTVPKGTAGSTVERVVGADVAQMKAMNSLKHSDIIAQYNKGIEGLSQNSWQTKNLVVTKPKSRTLMMFFDEATYTRLSFGQEMELKNLMKTMTSTATKNGEPIVVQWFYFIGGQARRIVL
jgi:hypothetical protein